MTAADEAKAVPVISLPGCQLVTSVACHWFPDCDVTYWREKWREFVNKGCKLSIDLPIVYCPISNVQVLSESCTTSLSLNSLSVVFLYSLLGSADWKTITQRNSLLLIGQRTTNFSSSRTQMQLLSTNDNLTLQSAESRLCWRTLSYIQRKMTAPDLWLSGCLVCVHGTAPSDNKQINNVRFQRQIQGRVWSVVLMRSRVLGWNFAL